MGRMLTDLEVAVCGLLSGWDRGLAARYRDHVTTGTPLNTADAEAVALVEPLARY
ncbi:hypothetical protein GCM10010210_49250 [Pseudonocardia hydrocarbonoxydans]|uniref:Uncharacterized protein n=1 Tax=Pseudonocardia hydrocarbonoxydans TaxID=76726 RepID=A0A4Y3WTV7_9PSEU|nr:hypothetical protein PHY01_44870 [Pseudonocardia hydrocarbonoxydans]